MCLKSLLQIEKELLVYNKQTHEEKQRIRSHQKRLAVWISLKKVIQGFLDNLIAENAEFLGRKCERWGAIYRFFPLQSWKGE